MLTANQRRATPGPDDSDRSDQALASLAAQLERAFGMPMTLIDGSTGDVLRAGGAASRDWGLRAEVCREVARRGRPELIDDEDPLITLAIPLADRAGNPVVAAGTFVTRGVGVDEDLSRQAEALGMDAGSAALWASRQSPWPAEALLRAAELFVSNWETRRRVDELEREARDLSVHLASTYEEISLLYRLTQNLRISASDEQLGRLALEWMSDVVPAAAVAIQLLPLAGSGGSVRHEARNRPVFLSHGQCPLDNDRFTALVAHLGAAVLAHPVVVNPPRSRQDEWPEKDVRQLIVVSLAEGDNLFGYLAALNHVDDGEFGTVEASLLSSVAAILGIHSGNIELYRRQAELLAGIVRALTSAIDAKDPYTCGHSDRVARFAVRIAEQLGCDAKTLDTIYLAGLLHDIGKIGVDDHVLRKPDQLTNEEYEHIKRHVEIGHKILSGLGKLEDVLPVVLYHHESWDGAGYPEKLQADRIPLAARIVAVADSYDAMSSDRPYRKGMPPEKIEAIFRSGQGRQWDPRVVEAFFQVWDDLRAMAAEDRRGAPQDRPLEAVPS